MLARIFFSFLSNDSHDIIPGVASAAKKFARAAKEFAGVSDSLRKSSAQKILRGGCGVGGGTCPRFFWKRLESENDWKQAFAEEKNTCTT